MTDRPRRALDREQIEDILCALLIRVSDDDETPDPPGDLVIAEHLGLSQSTIAEHRRLYAGVRSRGRRKGSHLIAQIRAAIAAGTPPTTIASDLSCTAAHVRAVRASLASDGTQE